MGKKLFGKVLICVLSIVLCFGFVGVRETHAAAKNKVINQSTGVEYATFSEAITALGTGSAGESTVLIVDGTVNETVGGDIDIDYEGQLSILGVNDARIFAPPTRIDYKINFNEKCNVEIIKDIRFGPAPANNSYYDSHYIIEVYGNVERIENTYLCGSDYDTYYFNQTILCVNNGGRVGVLKNVGHYKGDLPSLGERIVVDSGATVDNIIIDDTSCSIEELDISGSVGEISLPRGANTIALDSGDPLRFVSTYNTVFAMNISGIVNKISGDISTIEGETNGTVKMMENVYCSGGLSINEGSNVGTIKNSTISGIYVSGSVDVLDGVTVFTRNLNEFGWGCGGLEVYGRVGKIIGNTKFYYEPEFVGSAMANYSDSPLYLEPDLNGQDVGNGSYGNRSMDGSGYDYEWHSTTNACPRDYILQDTTGTVVFPTYKSDVDGKYYYYEFSQEPDSEGWYHLVKGSTQAPEPVPDIEPTLSKRLIQNGEGTLPDMTFNFTFERKSEWEGVQYVSEAIDHASIDDKTVTITSSDIFTGTDPYVGDLTGKKIYEGKIDNVLSGFAPKAAGTYCYLVREEKPATPLSDVTYTGSQFIMLVEVEDAGGGVYNPTKVTNILYKDSAGKTKADYPNPPTVFDEKHDLIFYNTYGSSGGTTPTGIMTNILPFIVIGGAGVGGLTLYVMHNLRRKRKEIS